MIQRARHLALPATLAAALCGCTSVVDVAPVEEPSKTTNASYPDIPRHGASALARFDELLRFVPSDMESYWFSDCRNVHTPWSSDHLTVRSGRDFAPGMPQRLGVNRHTFVEVVDHGPAGAPEAPESIGDQKCIASEPIDGQAAWQMPEDLTGAALRYERWVAIVDERFEVAASTRELLVSSLRSTTTRTELLARMPSCELLSANACDWVLRITPWETGQEVPMLTQVWSSPWRMEVATDNQTSELVKEIALHYPNGKRRICSGPKPHGKLELLLVEIDDEDFSWWLALGFFYGLIICI